jgi:hypothetical protein
MLEDTGKIELICDIDEVPDLEEFAALERELDVRDPSAVC